MSRARLWVTAGPEVGRAIAIGPRAVLGRGAGCDVRLGGTSISRRHARIERTAAGWTAVDLGSTNGLRHNGRRVERALLGDGDELALGNVRLRFRSEPEAEGEAAEPARPERSARRAGDWLGADLGQRTPGGQLLLVLFALGAAALLGWGAFLLARGLAG